MSATAWPELPPAALRGIAAEFVDTIGPHTEADPAGLLVDFAVSFGSAVGAGPHAIADGAQHPARLFAVLVGETSRARKGTTRANVRKVYEDADPGWSENRVMGGLSSGEGLIDALADPDEDGKGGTTDKRLLVYESEFARVLGVIGREGSTLSPVVRDAWDTGRLGVMNRKANRLRVSGAHVSIIGHVTVEELRRRLTETESANGFANRFLFCCVRRSKLLPNGGNLEDQARLALAHRIRDALQKARTVGVMRRTPDAEAYWSELYEEMANSDPGGLVGAVTARAEAQALRLSVLYALIDGTGRIGVEHVEAGHALWRYCEASAAYVFGDSIGDEVADRLLAALRSAGPEGLDGTQQRDVFARHVSAKRIAAARELLEARRLAATRTEQTGGRPRTITVATGAQSVVGAPTEVTAPRSLSAHPPARPPSRPDPDEAPDDVPDWKLDQAPTPERPTDADLDRWAARLGIDDDDEAA